MIFVSKIIEKVVATRLNEHLSRNNLMEDMQSAYRQSHSTETALLCVKNGILVALYQRKMVSLVLDLSAAFDTIDHNIHNIKHVHISRPKQDLYCNVTIKT